MAPDLSASKNNEVMPSWKLELLLTYISSKANRDCIQIQTSHQPATTVCEDAKLQIYKRQFNQLCIKFLSDRNTNTIWKCHPLMFRIGVCFDR